MKHALSVYTVSAWFLRILSAALVLLLILALLPIPSARADGTGSPVSDLTVQYVSGATHAKACQTFTETFRVQNLGPDPARNVSVQAGGTDQFDPASPGSWFAGPFDLAPGGTRTFTFSYKVTAFGFGESRQGRVYANVSSDIYPDTAIDPLPDNNFAESPLRLISKPASGCP